MHSQKLIFLPQMSFLGMFGQHILLVWWHVLISSSAVCSTRRRRRGGRSAGNHKGDGQREGGEEE